MAVGDRSVTRLVLEGTNAGPLGRFSPTDRRARVELCSIARWDDGQIVEEHWYYDMHGLLAQLGHVRPLGDR